MKQRGGSARMVGAAIAGSATAAAGAQSLFLRPADRQPPTPASASGAPGAQALANPNAVAPPPKINPVASLDGISLTAVQPATAKQYRVHDLVTIIVNQSSKIEHDQKNDLKKDYSDKAVLNALPDLWKIFEARLESGRKGGQNGGLPSLDLTSNNKFKGDGQYEREDRVTARVTAEVIDVKPNGLLVLEARTTTISDNEEQTMTLSGTCRGEDITDKNTIQSTQLSDLHLETKNKGDVKNTATKGLIPRVLETIFNF